MKWNKTNGNKRLTLIGLFGGKEDINSNSFVNAGYYRVQFSETKLKFGKMVLTTLIFCATYAVIMVWCILGVQ